MKSIFILAFLVLTIGAWHAWAAAPKPDSVWFQCRNGICIAPADQVDALIEYVRHLEKLAARDCFLKKVGNEYSTETR